MVTKTLEQRLNGLEHLKPELLEELDKGRIDFSKRQNWELLPREKGGQIGYHTPKAWKFAYSNKIVKYFESIDAPLEYKFGENLYGKFTKENMRKIIWGILSLPDIPKEIYGELPDLKKLYLAAGAYAKRDTGDIKDKPIAQIVEAYIRAGYNYLHQTGQKKSKPAERKAEPPTKYVGAISKMPELTIPEGPTQLYQTYKTLLTTAYNDPSDENKERVGIFLDGCSEKQLELLTRKFGTARMGGYATPALCKSKTQDTSVPF